MKVMEGTVSEVLSHSLSITNGLNILSCVCLLVMVCQIKIIQIIPYLPVEFSAKTQERPREREGGGKQKNSTQIQGQRENKPSISLLLICNDVLSVAYYVCTQVVTSIAILLLSHIFLYFLFPRHSNPELKYIMHYRITS